MALMVESSYWLTEAGITDVESYATPSMDESLQSEVNSQILSRLLTLTETTAHPFLLIENWQNAPESFTHSRFKFSLLAPGHSVLNGNVLDYALLSDRLVGCAGARATNQSSGSFL